MIETGETKRATAELWIRDHNAAAKLLDVGEDGFTYEWAGRVHFKPWGDLLARYYGRAVAAIASRRREAV